MESYNHYVDYTRSGRKAVFELLNGNSYLSFAMLMKKLHEKNIRLTDQTLRNYMSQWRLYSKNGGVPRLHFGLGRLDSGFDAGLWESAPTFGWKESRNKNRCRRLFKSGVWLDWHRNGTIVFRFRGSLPEGYLLGVFSQAFWNIMKFSGKPEVEITEYLRALFKERYHQVSRHSVYETGVPLPKKIIDRKKSHGEVIKLGDGSHPTSVEIEETEPFWASELKEAAVHMSKNLKSHVEVMRVTKEVVQELKSESLKRQEALKRITSPQEQDSFFVDNWFWIVEKLDFPVKGWCGRCHKRDRLLYYVEDRYGYSSIVCEDCGSLLKRLIDGGALL